MAVVLTLLLATMKRKRFVVTGRAANKRRRREGIVEELFQLDDATFLRMMRMPKNIFKSLAVRITPHLRCHWTPHSRRMAKVGNGSEVSPELILAATIRWLAGGSVWDVGFMFKLSAQGTFHDYKWRVIDALNDVLKDNVNFPLTDEGLSCLSQGFADRDDNIPNVVAAVDCAVLQMRAPPRAPFKDKDKRQTNVSSEYCRKGFFGTTVLAFVDAHMRFLSISITCGSSSHDSTMFEASKMGRLLTKPKGEGGIDNKWVVLGDDAFKAVPHVMTPFQKTWLTPQQKNFNYCLSKLRSTVECAFGLWKGKWGIFWRPLQVNKKNIRKLVEVTARLHNLCINRKVSDNLADFVVADDIFWQRTCSDAVRAKYRKRGRLPPPPAPANAEADFADAATVAQIMEGVPTPEGMRLLRRQAMERIENSGTVRRIARSAAKRARIRANVHDAEQQHIGDVDV
jgi:hypothetical protein